MARLTLAALIAVVSLVGCGSSSSETSSVAPANEKAAITEATSSWTPEKVEAFKKAHNEEGRMTPGQKLGTNPTSDQKSK